MVLGVPILNPFALRMAKTLWSFGRSECKRVKYFRVVCESFQSTCNL